MKIMLLGPGPDRIGKTSELDRYAVQALRFLRNEGHRVVWVDDNPATLASSRGQADSVYLEPLTLRLLERIIERERPEGLMYGFGGSLATHLVIFLDREGVLDRCDVKVLGTNVPALKRFMDAEVFKRAMRESGVPFMKAEVIDNVDECIEVAKSFGFPLILRPSFALEGIGGYLAYNLEEVKNFARVALDLSPVKEVLLERAPADWVQFAIEAIHDPNHPGRVHLVGTFEALGGGVGVHPGNSVVIAPAPTLKGALLKKALNWAGLIAKFIEVSGSFQVRFALAPDGEEMVVLRAVHGLNRFSSLFSILCSVPLGPINAALSLGSSMDELAQKMDLGRFPWKENGDLSIARIPIFSDAFRGAKISASTMRSTGAAVTIERGLSRVLVKAVDFLSVSGFFKATGLTEPDSELKYIEASADRLLELIRTLEKNEEGTQRRPPTGFDPAFFPPLLDAVSLGRQLTAWPDGTVPDELIGEAKAAGFSDRRIAQLTRLHEHTIREIRRKLRLHPRLAPVRPDDQHSRGTYSFLSYRERANHVRKHKEAPEALLVLGPGPFRIGWGSEVDQILVQTARALKAQGKRVILIHNNPDAISLDPDSVDCVCLDTPELEVIDGLLDEWPIEGLVHQFCLDMHDDLEDLLERRGVKLLGTPLRSLSTIRNAPLLWHTLKGLGIPLLSHAFANDATIALDEASKLEYPILVRLTDDALNPDAEIVHDKAALLTFLSRHHDRISEERPVYMEFHQEGILSTEILALCDGKESVTLAFLENIEEYGVHSGDCASTIPTLSIGNPIKSSAENALKAIVRHFQIVGHVQIKLAIKGRNVYVTGVWPYPGRHLPLVEKATRYRFHEWLARLTLGETLADLDVNPLSWPRRFYVKEAVFPFSRFPGLNPALSPRMRSTGQVLGSDDTFGRAYLKSQMATNPKVPEKGRVFLSARDTEKEAMQAVSKKLLELGFSLVSTEGTAQFLAERGIEVDVIEKVSGGRPNIIDLIINGEIALVINIPGGIGSKLDQRAIYRSAVEHGVPLITTLSGANLIIRGFEEIRKSPLHCVELEM